jgi:hypothetical protein
MPYATDARPHATPVLSLLLLFLCCTVVPQYRCLAQTANLTPVRYVQHTDHQRVQAALHFVEQRVIARDDDYFFTILDSLVEWNAMLLPKADVVDVVHNIYDCSAVDVQVLAGEFVARGGDFEACFKISDAVPQRSVPDLQPGDTLTYRLTIHTASDLPATYSLVTVRKFWNDVTLPVVNYKISRIDDAFIEAIGSYHRSYIVRYVGDTGGLRNEWTETDTPGKLWDFIEDAPTSCVQTLQPLVAENSLHRVPIEINIPGGTITLPWVNRANTFAELGYDIAERPLDAWSFYDDALTESHTMLLWDDNWRRMLIANLQNAAITSHPLTDAQKNLHGIRFARPGPVSVSARAGSYFGMGIHCAVYDNDSSKLHQFEFDLNESTGLRHLGTWHPKLFLHSHTFGWHVTDRGGEITAFLSGKSNDSAMICMGHLDMYRRYIGYTSRCDSTRFFDAPTVNLDKDYFKGFADHETRYKGTDKLGIMHGTKFIISDNQKNYASGPGLMNEYIPAKSIMDFWPRWMSGFADIQTVSRMFDGHFMLSETRPYNLIHIFEPIDGKYVCSWSIPGGFSHLLSCRQVTDMRHLADPDDPYRLLYEAAITDLVVLEEWWTSKGLSRFLTWPELLGTQRIKAGDQNKPDELRFTVTARAEMSIALVDAQGAIVTVIEESMLRDPRMYRVSVPNPDRYDIRITMRSADTYNYGAYVQSDRVYTIHSDGSITKEAAPRRSGIAKVTDCSIFPNPGRSTMTLSYTLLEEGDVTVLITDLLGRTLYKQSGYITAPGTYQQGFNVSRMASGRYHVHILSGNSSRTIPMVKQ